MVTVVLWRKYTTDYVKIANKRRKGSMSQSNGAAFFPVAAILHKEQATSQGISA